MFSSCSFCDDEESTLALTTTNKENGLIYTYYSIVEASCSKAEIKNKRAQVISTITTYTTNANGVVIPLYFATTLTNAEAATTSSTSKTSSAISSTGSTTSSTNTATSSTKSTTSSTNTATSSTSSTAADAAGTTTPDATESDVTAKTTTGEYLGDGSSTTTVSSGATTSESHYTGPRSDPSTAITALPTSAITTLSVESYETITYGYTTFTTKRPKTSMWVTLTVQGIVEVIQTTFIQRFKTMYSSSFSGSSGSIGLGTLSGQIGQVKASYTITNPSYNAAPVGNSVHVSGLFVWLLLFFV